MFDSIKNNIKCLHDIKIESLALKERQHTLSVKRWRKWGAIVGYITVLFLCYKAVCVDERGLGLGCFSKAFCIDRYATNLCQRAVSPFVSSDNVVTNKNEFIVSSPAFTKNVFEDQRDITTSLSVTTTNVIRNNEATPKLCPHTYLPIVALILKGLFMFAGLGVAVLAVRFIANNQND